jgi:hypothetical protein
MDRNKLNVSLFTILSLSVLGGCAASQPGTRGDSSALIAMGPMTGPAPSAGEAAPIVAKVPDEVRHDPAARFAYTEGLRTQIVARTRGESDERYFSEVRPRLRRQIESAGLPRADVDLLLSEVDQSRRSGR